MSVPWLSLLYTAIVPVLEKPADLPIPVVLQSSAAVAGP